jgi:hypothetical protein
VRVTELHLLKEKYLIIECVGADYRLSLQTSHSKNLPEAQYKIRIDFILVARNDVCKKQKINHKVWTVTKSVVLSAAFQQTKKRSFGTPVCT